MTPSGLGEAVQQDFQAADRLKEEVTVFGLTYFVWLRCFGLIASIVSRMQSQPESSESPLRTANTKMLSPAHIWHFDNIHRPQRLFTDSDNRTAGKFYVNILMQTHPLSFSPGFIFWSLLQGCAHMIQNFGFSLSTRSLLAIRVTFKAVLAQRPERDITGSAPVSGTCSEHVP